jgi:MbtH protein
MANPFECDGEEYRVLANAAGEYSLWPALRETPKGWTAAGPTAGSRHCLEWIDIAWTSIGPKSIALAPRN